MAQSFDTDLVTVVISTYNRSKLLKRAIESVLDQTHVHFECLVVDDKSPDDTENIVKSFADSRIRYICHKENKGGPASRNTGISEAKGEYIAFLDDDDQWHPNKLSKQLAKMNTSAENVAVIYCGMELKDNKGKVLQAIVPQFKGNIYEHLLKRSFIPTSMALMKKECFKKVGNFDEQLKSCQDWDMFLRIAKYYNYDFNRENLVSISQHDLRISNNYASLIPGRIRMVEKHLEEFKRHPRVFIVHLKRIAKLHCLNGTWREAVDWFKKAIVVQKIELVKILAWCLFELPWVSLWSRANNFKRYDPERNM